MVTSGERDIGQHSCLAGKQLKMPAAVYFPTTANHFLVWQEQDGDSWVINGEHIQGKSGNSDFQRNQTFISAYNTNARSYHYHKTD